MRQLNIPFKLGMQYENWEFDLEVTQDRLQGYDSYIYTGKKFNNFLNYSKFKTELIFNLDILEALMISFENKNLIYFESLNQTLSKELTRINLEIINNIVIQKYINLDIELWCCYLNNTILIILGERSLVKRLLDTLN